MKRTPTLTASALLLTGLAAISSLAHAQTVQQFTVARDKDGRVGYRFPDLAQAANGDLVVVSLESEDHNGGAVATIVAHISADKGRTWSERLVVNHTTPYVKNCPEERQGWLTTPRLIRLQDRTLLLAVDRMPMSPRTGAHRYWRHANSLVEFYRSADYGRTWTGPEKSPIRGIVPGLIELRTGVLLVTVTQFEENDNLRQYLALYRSSDNGKTWIGPTTLAEHPKSQPNEGDFLELATGEVVCYMRDDEPGGLKEGIKTISRDGGLTWSPVYGSGPWRYRGRPCAGLLRDGSVLLSTRVVKGNGGNDFGVYWEPATAALKPNLLDAAPPPEARWTILDRDRNKERPDWGYSGWVEFDDGSIYVVQYTTDDQPTKRTILRGYLLSKGYLDKMGRGEGPLDHQAPPDKKPQGKTAFDEVDGAGAPPSAK